MKPIAFGDPKSPHYCIGAALAKVLIKTNISVLLREYELVLDPNQSKNYKDFPDNSPSSEVIVQKLQKKSV